MCIFRCWAYWCIVPIPKCSHLGCTSQTTCFSYQNLKIFPCHSCNNYQKSIANYKYSSTTRFLKIFECYHAIPMSNMSQNDVQWATSTWTYQIQAQISKKNKFQCHPPSFCASPVKSTSRMLRISKDIIKTVHDVKNYYGPACTFQTFHKHNVPWHMYSFHLDIQSTKCAMCIYATYNEQDLAIHIETNHQQMKI